MYLELQAKDRKHAVLMYLKALQGFHKLTEKEIEVFSAIIMKYMYMRDKYDEEIAGRLYLAMHSRREIMEELGMRNGVFRNYLQSFRDKKLLLKGNEINKLFLPDYSKAKIEILITYSNGNGGQGPGENKS